MRDRPRMEQKNLNHRLDCPVFSRLHLPIRPMKTPPPSVVLHLVLFALLVSSGFTPVLRAQESTSTDSTNSTPRSTSRSRTNDVVTRIRDEGLNRSQVMQT